MNIVVYPSATSASVSVACPPLVVNNNKLIGSLYARLAQMEQQFTERLDALERQIEMLTKNKSILPVDERQSESKH